jgi:hypothetical protein
MTDSKIENDYSKVAQETGPRQNCELDINIQDEIKKEKDKGLVEGKKKSGCFKFTWKVWLVIGTVIVLLGAVFTIVGVVLSNKRSSEKIAIYEKTFGKKNTTVTVMLDDMGRNFTSLIKVSTDGGDCVTKINQDQKEYFCDGVLVNVTSSDEDMETFKLDSMDFSAEKNFNETLPMIPDQVKRNSLRRLFCFWSVVTNFVCTKVCSWVRVAKKSWWGWIISFLFQYLCNNKCERVASRILKCK